MPGVVASPIHDSAAVAFHSGKVLAAPEERADGTGPQSARQLYRPREFRFDMCLRRRLT